MSAEFDSQALTIAELAIDDYVQQMAALLNLSIPWAQMPGVIENFRQVQRIAQPVLEFQLPDELVAAPRFEP